MIGTLRESVQTPAIVTLLLIRRLHGPRLAVTYYTEHASILCRQIFKKKADSPSHFHRCLERTRHPSE